jgi:hypothetical protein
VKIRPTQGGGGGYQPMLSRGYITREQELREKLERKRKKRKER